MDDFWPIITVVIGSLFSGLLAYYFATKNNVVKLREISDDVVRNHIKINHQIKLEEFVEGELDKHQKSCGDELRKSFDKLETKIGTIDTKMQHMEIRQVESRMVMSSMSKILNKIANKMQIPEAIEPNTGD